MVGTLKKKVQEITRQRPMYRKAGQFVTNKAPVDSDATADDDSSSTTDEDSTTDDSTADSTADHSALATQIARVHPLTITRRKSMHGHERPQRKRHRSTRGVPRDVRAQQASWYQYASNAAALYTPSMWRVLHAMKNESKATQSRVLLACRRMLPRAQRHL